MQGIEELVEVAEDKFSPGICPWVDSCQLVQEALRERDKAVVESGKLITFMQINQAGNSLL